MKRKILNIFHPLLTLLCALATFQGLMFWRQLDKEAPKLMFVRNDRQPETGPNKPIWKMKEDIHDQGKYRRIFTEPMLKLLERQLDGRGIECVNGEEQQLFRQGTGTTDSLFALGHFMENRLERQESVVYKRAREHWLCRREESIRQLMCREK